MSEKEIFKPGNMLYPLPAVMVSCADKSGKDNILTVAWTGTVCSDPPMLYISVRPGRFSHHMIEETGEFVVNLTTEKLARATDFCGVRSGRDVDKWEETRLTRKAAVSLQYAPAIAECPVNIECKVRKILRLGTHDMFLADVTGVQVSSSHSIKQDSSPIPMENTWDWERRSVHLATASERRKRNNKDPSGTRSAGKGASTPGSICLFFGIHLQERKGEWRIE